MKMRTSIAGVLIALATVAFVPQVTKAAGYGCQEKSACDLVKAGHERGRLPIACASFPFDMRYDGKVALFAVRHYSPNAPIEVRRAQLSDPSNVVFSDSKIASASDDFCRNPAKFVGARWVVLCDEHNGMGWMNDPEYSYTLRHGHPPGGERIRIGIF